MVNSSLRVMWILTLLCATATSLRPQESRGSISGRVVDAHGGSVPGSVAGARNTATGVMITNETNEQGNYRLDYLNPGSYELSVSHAGFRPVQQLVVVRINDRLQIDFILEVGQVTDSVTITGASPQLETVDGNIGQVIDNRRINDLALAQGNPTELLMFTSGWSPSSSDWFQNQEPGFGMVANEATFNGAPAGMATFTLDGMNNVADITRIYPNAMPPTEAIQEFVVSNSYDASVGQGAGTNVDVSLKAGTNALHGAAYGFYRSEALGANDFLNNRAGGEKTKTKFRRAGFNLGGPVFLPKVYNGKNRTFYSVSYESTYEQSAELDLGTLTVPTADERQGDFSKLLALGPGYQIYDPDTTTATGDGFYRRLPFAGNILPASRINTVAKNVQQYWPLPNLGGGPDGSLNYQPSGTGPNQWYQTYLRMDHAIGGRQRVFGHYGILEHSDTYNDYFRNAASGEQERFRRQTVGIDDVYVVNSRVALNFRYSFARWGTHQGYKYGFDAAGLGFSAQALQPLDLSAKLFPLFDVANYASLGAAGSHFSHGLNSHSALADLDYEKRSHTFKLGVDVRAYQYNRADVGQTNPLFTFDSTFTNGPVNSAAAAPEGQSYAAFLLGRPSGGSASRVDSYASTYPYFSVFAQDNWRVTPRLTLNLGLRYERYGAETERYNRSVRGYAFGEASPIEAAARAAYAINPVPGLPLDQFRVTGGLLFAGVGGQPRELYSVPSLQFGPRFGFAYRLSQRSVLRGGYGIFFLPIQMPKPILTGFSQATSLVPTLDSGVTFIANLDNPFPQGLLKPPGSASGLSTNLGKSITFFNTDGVGGPYVQRWSLTTQTMLPFDTLLEVSYLGTRSTRLLLSKNVDALPNSYLSALPYRDNNQIEFLSATFPNPFSGLLPGTSLNSTSISRNSLLVPFPQFTGMTTQAGQGYSWYHALEARIEKRMSAGLSYILSYTWSKNMSATGFLNAGDPTPYRTVSNLDRTHVLNVTAIWDLPFGKGRHFGPKAVPVLPHLVEGWTVSAIWQDMSGAPLTFPDLFFNGDIKKIPLSASRRTVDEWFNVDAGFVRDPAQQPSYHLRTFPTSLNSVRTDGINYWDMSLRKDVFETEKVRLQFRTDFFNAFNHPSFGGVDTTPSSGSFGAVTTEMTLPRRIQFGLKLAF